MGTAVTPPGTALCCPKGAKPLGGREARCELGCVRWGLGGGLGMSPTFFFSERSFHMRASSRVSSLSDSSGRSSCSCFRFSSEKMNMAEMGRLGFSELAWGQQCG